MTSRFPVEEEGLRRLLDEAWSLSRARHGNRLDVYVPGMFVVDGKRGRYRAVSLTGNRCELDCEHCKGFLLKTMPHATDPDALIKMGREAEARGDVGLLLTGGCDASGRLPWETYTPVIAALKADTNLFITVHAGQVDTETALALKVAGVDQALVDVIGDDATARDVYHLTDGTASIRRTMDALSKAGLEIVPHVLFGLHFGKEKGEYRALDMLRDYPLRQYVVVVIMPFRDTPMASVEPPPPARAARFIASARLALPGVKASLGCARPRGRYRHELDVLAVRAGINALALPSDRALDEARARGLEVVLSETCCSISPEALR